MALRHIFVRISSRRTTISCVPYCILQGFVVNMLLGTRCLNSSQMKSARGGLKRWNLMMKLNSVQSNLFLVLTWVKCWRIRNPKARERRWTATFLQGLGILWSYRPALWIVSVMTMTMKLFLGNPIRSCPWVWNKSEALHSNRRREYEASQTP